MPRRKLSTKPAENWAVPPDSHAMSGRLDATSAREPSGHAAAAPPSSLMTSRRLMLSLRPRSGPYHIVRWLSCASQHNCTITDFVIFDQVKWGLPIGPYRL